MTEVFYSKELSKELLEKIKEEIKENFKDCNKIAVKIHFGEPGNETSFKPEQVKPFIDILKELNINYFMFDSSVAYNSPRHYPESHKKHAISKGWDKLGEIDTDDSEYITVKGENMEYQVCKTLVDAEGVLVISHFKGHICAGFGGAIKSLGMGALTNTTKAGIHSGAKPDYVGGCTQCMNCVKACPAKGISVTDHPKFTACYGCSICADVCPVDAIKPKLNNFDILLAEGAYSAQKNFKKFYYINVLKNISKKCDCAADPGGIIADDAGYLCSKDAVSIDQASYDLIKEEQGKDVFQENNNKSGLGQIKHTEEFGMGSSEYDLINV